MSNSKSNVSPEESAIQIEEFRRNYKPFKPFVLDGNIMGKLAVHMGDLVRAQNGQDTDDYFLGIPTKLERYLPNLPLDSRVLLLGTGCGREVGDAIDKGVDAYGTTLGSRNIDFAVDVLDLKGKVVECLNESLPFSEEFFDVVAGFQVFEHAFSPLLFLLEQRRVLKLGGTLCLEWPPAKDYTMEDNPHHFICYTPGQARALFQKAGFIDIEVFFLHNGEKHMVPEDKMWDGTGMFDIYSGDKVESVQAHYCITGKKYRCHHWTY